jgi:hypothetical protein
MTNYYYHRNHAPLSQIERELETALANAEEAFWQSKCLLHQVCVQCFDSEKQAYYYKIDSRSR